MSQFTQSQRPPYGKELFQDPKMVAAREEIAKRIGITRYDVEELLPGIPLPTEEQVRILIDNPRGN